ncbi:GIY-YIG nuclease family protein [Deinococcus aquaticus]|uniref:GIY-YIG nuclease family protein n=1 Tax=Deinococcus aquaticus TaxID=328692 RepID=UPI003F476DD6
MTDDRPRKLALLDGWLTQHAAFRIAFHPGGSLAGMQTLARLRGALPRPQESVYVLVAREAPTTPLYVGRALNPVQRWQSHLRALAAPSAHSTAWQAHFTGPLDLYVIPVAEMKGPPIPCFPLTAGAVESQLISLAQDVSPVLLNREGVRR